MEQGGRSGGVGWQMPTEEEVEVAEILVNLPKLLKKSELISRYSFTWGRKKKRSVLDSKSESESSPLSQPEKSPSTPLCLLPSGAGSDGGDKPKPPASAKIIWKRKKTEDLMEAYSRVQQEKDILMKKVTAMESKEHTYENLELKTKGQKINYPTNMEHYHTWNSTMKTNEQQHCHQQITMFGPSTSQSVVDPINGKVMTGSCSSNSNGGGSFGSFNQIDPRVKIHREYYDFMGSSQPLDQSKYLLTDSDLRVRAAAVARMRRKLRMKEVKNSLLAMKLSRSGR